MPRPFQFSLRSLFVVVLIASFLSLGIRILGREDSIALWFILLLGFAYGCRFKQNSTQCTDLLEVAQGGLWGALYAFLATFYIFLF